MEHGFRCPFCQLFIEARLVGPIDTIECPRCMAVYQFALNNTTMYGVYNIWMRVLREGSGKFVTKNNNKTQYV